MILSKPSSQCKQEASLKLFETSSFLVYVYYSLMKSSAKKIGNHPKGGTQ